MNRYKKLLSNTVLFAVGTFSSKALVFLLMPLYTAVLSTQEYGTVDLIMQAGNLLLPLVSVGIINSIVRFGCLYHRAYYGVLRVSCFAPLSSAAPQNFLYFG